jgi:hypothetical protein
VPEAASPRNSRQEAAVVAAASPRNSRQEAAAASPAAASPAASEKSGRHEPVAAAASSRNSRQEAAAAEEEEEEAIVRRPHSHHEAVQREDSLMSDRTLSNRSSVSSGKVGKVFFIWQCAHFLIRYFIDGLYFHRLQTVVPYFFFF